MTITRLFTLTVGLGVAATLALGGCEKKPESSPPATTTGGGGEHDGQAQAPERGHDHDHGPTIALGEAAIGAFRCAVTRDEGPITPGGDTAIDATITGEGAIGAVRFWIGTQDAKGSIKAKAAIEDPAEPNRWHTHAEIPSPMPEGAMLWVEIETGAGEKIAGSFELKG